MIRLLMTCLDGFVREHSVRAMANTYWTTSAAGFGSLVNQTYGLAEISRDVNRFVIAGFLTMSLLLLVFGAWLDTGRGLGEGEVLPGDLTGGATLGTACR